MSTIVERRTSTADDLLTMPDGKRFELVYGELVEKDVGWESEWVGTNLVALLWVYCRLHGGWVNGSSAGYRCFEESIPDDPERVRKPDVSYIAPERMTSGQIPVGHCELVPDLVVEVNSPNDRRSKIESKVIEYLQAGVRLVWVIDPPTESVVVHRQNGTVSELGLTDELDGEDVAAGFRCPVRELFASPSKGT